MTPEELKKLIAAAADPNKSADALTTLSDRVMGMISEAAESKKAASEAEETISSLRDTNMRLFLRTTGALTEEPEEPKKISDMSRDELDAYFKAKLCAKEDV